MNRRSHDSSRPQTAPDGARFRDENCYAETASGRLADVVELRPRVNYHSADCVTLRMTEAGRQARVRGSVSEVLGAVIALLPRDWSRISDNRVRLSQLVNLCPSRPHQRTVGRALRRLADLDFLHYEPACGRGATALIQVHERFLHGISELERDESGAVVVPFSGPYTSLFPKGKVPQPAKQEPAADAVTECRPIEVAVDRNELRTILDQLPPLLADLPRNLRWLLGREVHAKLARGHLPEEILRILEAPAPAGVERPYKLAVWRLTQNMPGAGPRLRPLQRQWDQEQRAADEQARIATVAEDYRQVEEATTAEQRDQLVVAMGELFGRADDPRTAILTAVRRARRQYPGLPAAAAVDSWLAHGDRRLAPRTAPVGVVDSPLGLEGLSSIRELGVQLCVSCGGPGVVRPELPLPTVACDGCLSAAAAEEPWERAS